ncbi:hypothetical protein NY2A_b263R [Paramecium bursaria Chlorella virus NY2A]|uniref:Uncharacterized protein b263R n=1 Tax=Paramecium bursaria Chlorella virus NY2A TaxID=46021 RepID=A7IWD8_PBCVN|nr:hypothetical protein NY2A_b263R [Paramecium bursaria Chlorella virus NY2A]ABT14662.1 hypothetical protein NY2A_b263R [Paramecium bursaria Chlorella virus NY2A]
MFRTFTPSSYVCSHMYSSKESESSFRWTRETFAPSRAEMRIPVGPNDSMTSCKISFKQSKRLFITFP